MVVTSARIPVSIRILIRSVGSPVCARYTHRGSSPIGTFPPGSDIQLNSPVMICWETPATMKSPTPEPMPHLETISSINKIRTPPAHIWIRRRSMIVDGSTPSSAAIMVDGLMYPPSTCGSAVNRIITKTSSFCAP
ncbi:MAG: hypothetical protein C5S49_02525 [Candidatus Methanogaster sp.]|nr:MAG: hypothetical protein C5S49_02525 [ANME-2 cluster archaeon]